MALSSSNAVRQLSDGNSQGTILGQSSTDLIGFYGLSAGVAKSGTNFATLSSSTGPLASSIAMLLGSLGIITCTSVAA
jgi:hypothetical protein